MSLVHDPVSSAGLRSGRVAKWMALGTALTLVSAPVFWQFGHRPVTPVAAGRCALVVVSALASVFVISHNYSISAHP